MVRAILEGRKYQTRRVVNPRPSGIDHRLGRLLAGGKKNLRGQFGLFYKVIGQGVALTEMTACPYGNVGDLLWVREHWCWRIEFDDFPPRDIPHYAGASVWYFATDEEYCATHPEPGRWRRSFHMPRWASRLTLRITDVRVERVQDISQRDVFAEGLSNRDMNTVYGGGSAVECFSVLWDSINAARGFGWEQNPWVWALTFETIHKNVDAVIAEQEERSATANA